MTPADEWGDMGDDPLCDWWLADRSKCNEPGTEVTADKYGAPLWFCKTHLPLAYAQYPMPEPDPA